MFYKVINVSKRELEDFLNKGEFEEIVNTMSLNNGLYTVVYLQRRKPKTFIREVGKLKEGIIVEHPKYGLYYTTNEITYDGKLMKLLSVENKNNFILVSVDEKMEIVSANKN